MISNYLSLLYSNCKTLTKTTHYNSSGLSGFFQKHIEDILEDQGLSSEDILLNILTSRPYTELQSLFNKSLPLHIFYLVNSLNEFKADPTSYDNLGRFKYEHSAIKTSGIEANKVLELILLSVKETSFLNSCFTLSHHKSYFYLSHDVDSVYGSFTQDGLWAIKNGRIDVLLKVFFDTMMLRPDWFNFDLVMKTESAYDFKSTFYWLVNKGRVDARQINSDYSVTSPKIIRQMKEISALGFENGLHKSISEENFKSEISKLPVEIQGNRYHYLKFQLPEAYDKIEASGLKLDASLGFAEHYGFRNGYGYPFHPYNINTGNPYSFLEVPLNIMDGTFQRYMKVPVEKTACTIIDFLEKHHENSLLSILWHNTFFSDYKHQGYLNQYKKILAYLHETKFQNINQSDIIKKFSWQVK